MINRTINNISIRWLLTVPMGLLALLLIANMAWETVTVYQPRSQQATRLHLANEVADDLLTVAASAAQERGFTASYLSKLESGQGTKELHDAIGKQRLKGDHALQEALTKIERFTSATGEDLSEQIEALEKDHDAVLKERAAVDKAATSATLPDKAQWFKTATNYIFAASSLRLAAFRPTNETDIAEYSNNMIKQSLWMAAEYAGRERAVMGQLIAHGKPMDEKTSARLAEYRSQVEGALSFVKSIAIPLLTAKPATPNLGHQISDAWQAVEHDFLGTFQDFRLKVYAAAATGKYPVDANTWLKHSTKAIDTLFAFSNVVGRDTVVRVKAFNDASSLSLWGVTAMTLASIVTALFVLLLITLVIRRLHVLNDTIISVQNNNDLSLRADESGTNELSDVAKAFNSMVGRFADIVNSVVRSTSAVTERVANLVSASEQADRGIQSQNTAIDQVAAAIHEMTATAREVAETTLRAEESAKAANSKARDGKDGVMQSMEAISALENNVEQGAAVIDRLKEDSLEISQVMEVITGIAEQTNLLALNAAIEAARAGEFGRGFAVVAGEVRALAARTRESTDEIRSTIERLQKRAEDAVRAMHSGCEQARSTVTLTAGANGSLDEIVSTVDTIMHMNSQIATAAEQQTQVAEDINRNVSDISSVTEDTSRAAGDTVRAGEMISDEMERLRQIVIHFKTGTDAIDLTAAKTAHLAWKSRLGAYLNGTGSLTKEQAMSHKECVLGKWYYTEGLAKFGHVPQMREVEHPHEEMHRLIRQIIELRESGQMEKAQEAYSQIGPLSQKIVGLLESIEQVVRDTQAASGGN